MGKLGEIAMDVKENHNMLTKSLFIKEWHLISLKSVRASSHHDFFLKRASFHKFREGIIIHQINTQKKIKAGKFRIKKLKSDLLWFFKEYLFEQQTKRSQR